MTTQRKLAAVVLVLTGMTILSHGVDAVEREHRPYETVSRVVQPGQSLWDICSKLNSSEDIRAIIDRTRVDNDVDDPGALQPGKVLMIRYKR
ncbi:LysM domain-containing protein [uncultured Acidaminococcus sp.]|uniref:LysM peptidoglycan-binding domain-containing protein n=1 Tax=uncultured Acidaminococcus sp. TaxID=352152 RepID=UPI002589F7A6|nr:LysM domain-containing protein [uncultured Acidaminococcus sp.]